MRANNHSSTTAREARRRLPISVPGMLQVDPVDAESDKDEIATPELGSPGSEADPEGASLPDKESQPGPLPTQPWRKVIFFGILGAVLVATSLSPLGLGQLAFLGIAPWAWLTLDARRVGAVGYVWLFASGLMLWIWLFVVEVDLGGGALLAALPLIAYLALYVPLFVGLGRMARSLTRLPAYLTLPIIWCGLEWLRCHLFGGFSLGLLAHAAADTRRVLQLTDLIGSYGLGMLMVASGASVAELFWVTRRIRHLEQRLPASVPMAADDSAVFTSANRFISGSFRGRPAQAKADARTSMEAAVRRSRDYARDVHLLSVALSVAVVVGVLVFANSYGRSRVQETRTWKLFETNQFGITVLGAEEDETLFQVEARRNNKSLLVACFDKPVHLMEAPRPTLAIYRDSPDRERAAASTWQVDLHRTKTQVDSNSLALDPAFVIWQSIGMGELPSCRFHGQASNVPLNVLATVTPAINVEQSVNDCLRAEPGLGRGIDVTIVTVEPGMLDGSCWPRLLTRSVIASAVANRCPVIACVPGRMSAVANGDGDLWWSSAFEANSEEGDPTTQGQSTNEPIRLQAMIDPRVSYFVATAGSLPALGCALLTLALPVFVLVRKLRGRRSGRFPSAKMHRYERTAG